MTPDDMKQLTELFRRVNAGGPGQATATRRFEEKAASLGLDSFTLFNDLQRGGSLTIYQPAQPPALRPEPRRVAPQSKPITQTSTGGPSGRGLADTVRFRLYCAFSERNSAVAVFKLRQSRDAYDFQRWEDKAPRPVEGNGVAADPTIPVDLLAWGEALCPNCRVPFKDAAGAPLGLIVCGACHKPRCTRGLFKHLEHGKTRRQFHCICGTTSEIETRPGLHIAHAPETLPQAAASARCDQPALEGAPASLRLGAPQGGR